MYTKIFTALALLLMLFGLMGLPTSYLHLLYLILPIISYLFARKFNLIPELVYLNYRAILYFMWLVKEILISSFRVIKIIWRVNLNLQPVFASVEHQQSNDPDIVLYANSVTLTPGTVTLDATSNTLLIHALEQSSVDSLKIGNLTMGQRIQKIRVG